jgi:hypothetical protein
VPENVSHLENPLLEEDTYNGRMFHASLPQNGRLNCGSLAEELEGTSVTLESDAVDIGQKDDLYIPDIFKSGVKDNAEIASIKNVTEFHHDDNNGIIGYLNHHDSNTVKFDDKEILTLDQKTTKFLIFEHSNQAFILILTSRDYIQMLYNILSEILTDYGFVVEEISISHSEFEQIADVLIDTHLMTSVDGYEESTIHKKHILGRGYGDSEEYQREKRHGTVNGQRFGTSKLDTSDKTIQISQDCLIRGYHSVTLSMYLSMITTYIIPSLSLTIQTSIDAYDSENSIIKPEKVKED